jgi:hypothetical protein
LLDTVLLTEVKGKVNGNTAALTPTWAVYTTADPAMTTNLAGFKFVHHGPSLAILAVNEY